MFRHSLLSLLGAAVPPPVNTVAPSISGTLNIGQTLTASTGTWSGSPTYTYQWKRGGVDIGGATASTYATVLADLGATITVTVTATNAGGQASATSAGSVIFTPSSVSGQLLWLQADSITSLSDGDPVSTWNDSSSNANNTTGTTTTRPLYKTAIINGLPVVRFDGTDDFLALGSALSNQAWHVFAVVRSIGTSTRTLLGGATGSFQYRTNLLKQEVLKGSTASIGSSTSDVTTPAVISASYATPNAAFYLNGAADGTASSAQTFTANVVRVGRSTVSTGEPYANDIAELIVYNAVLSAGNRGSVTTYLGAKWGIAVS